MAKKVRSQKQVILIAVEGKAEAKFFDYLNWGKIGIAPHWETRTHYVGGNSERVLEEAKRLKKDAENNRAPYAHIFAVCDRDAGWSENIQQKFSQENIFLIVCDPRIENVLMECKNYSIPRDAQPRTPEASKIAKDHFKRDDLFGCDAHKLNYSQGIFTRQQIHSCPLLTQWWEIVGIKQ